MSAPAAGDREPVLEEPAPLAGVAPALEEPSAPAAEDDGACGSSGGTQQPSEYGGPAGRSAEGVCTWRRSGTSSSL